MSNLKDKFIGATRAIEIAARAFDSFAIEVSKLCSETSQQVKYKRWKRRGIGRLPKVVRRVRQRPVIYKVGDKVVMHPNIFKEFKRSIERKKERTNVRSNIKT